MKFHNNKDVEFAKALRLRVGEYFKSTNQNRYANTEMVVKTIVMFLIYFVPYSIMLATENVWVLLVAYIFMGVGTAGLGLSVMHDANHGAYSSKQMINRLLGYSMNLIGGNATNWIIQHNVNHHTYTNIHTHDEDIRPRIAMRLSPHAKKYKIHRFQHIYGWFLYGFMTFNWIVLKDFTQFISYQKEGALKKQGVNLAKAWVWLVLTKVFYYVYILVIPILVVPFAWWQVLIGFVLMHYVAGFILAIVFQPAHVMEHNLFPEADGNDSIEENWMVHQLQTTCNFAGSNPLVSWFVGGLNFQIEHHLFPNICHVHYRKLAKIVKETAEEYHFPYHDIGSFRKALYFHGRMLYKLGHM